MHLNDEVGFRHGQGSPVHGEVDGGQGEQDFTVGIAEADVQPALPAEVLDIRAELDDEVHGLVGSGEAVGVDAPERAEDVELATLINIGVVGDEEDEFFH